MLFNDGMRGRRACLLSSPIISSTRERKRFPVLFDSTLTQPTLSLCLPPRNFFPFISLPASSSPVIVASLLRAARSFVFLLNLRRLINSSGRQMTASAPSLLNQSGRGAPRFPSAPIADEPAAADERSNMQTDMEAERGEALVSFPVLLLSRLSDKSCGGMPF